MLMDGYIWLYRAYRVWRFIYSDRLIESYIGHISRFDVRV